MKLKLIEEESESGHQAIEIINCSVRMEYSPILILVVFESLTCKEVPCYALFHNFFANLPISVSTMEIPGWKMVWVSESMSRHLLIAKIRSRSDVVR